MLHLVINKVRVLGRGPHTPTQFVGSTHPGILEEVTFDSSSFYGNILLKDPRLLCLRYR